MGASLEEVVVHIVGVFKQAVGVFKQAFAVLIYVIAREMKSDYITITRKMVYSILPLIFRIGATTF